MLSLFVAVLIGASGTSPSFDPQSAQQIPQEQKPSEHYAQAQPSVQETKPATEQRAGEKENGESCAAWLWKFCDRWGNAINAISTFVIACFTVVLWWSTHLLWTSGKKHSERELRAYVFPVDFEVRNFGTPEISAFVKIKNSGQTPAYKLTCQVKMIVGPFPQTDFTISEEEADFTPGYLGPEVTSLYFPIKATPLAMEHGRDVLMGKWAIYVFGRIDYVDAFDKPRWTTFRTHARGEQGAMLHKEGKGDVLTPITDKEGNDAA